MCVYSIYVCVCVFYTYIYTLLFLQVDDVVISTDLSPGDNHHSGASLLFTMKRELRLKLIRSHV